ncbi:hypothetical protein B0H15DRAFT_425762 [Mycena belliarum]|uniref:P-loop containing nucleoside triphosphate hydrolase protein n=1 Tax=Mycena belliarum TaxID=1033014 RepID=A0AAD6U3H1_9AGAR|nr:hypothetical protein B0H15DRAFT_425762 [Mycena belliae]
MDLENFNDVGGLDELETLDMNHEDSSSQTALNELDQRWYSFATRRARWMDLLGDYAGAELFVIAGESLLERVLDDPLLAIGRGDDLSFQILHAYYLLETILLQFISRRANFEIVFWHTNYHSTVHTGASSFVVASRCLARSLLFEHLLKLDVVVHTFEDLADPSWLRFEADRRPMFVLINDGGVADQHVFQSHRTLLQRLFLFNLIKNGMAIALLNGAEFRDSKISSFIFHEAHERGRQRYLMDPGAQSSLDAEMAKHTPTSTRLDSRLSASVRPTPDRLIEFSKRAIQLTSKFSAELLHIFLAHAAMLPELSLLERAQSFPSLSPKLRKLLLKWLPDIYFAASPLPFDIDGRIFVSLVSTVLAQPSQAFRDIIGPAAYDVVEVVWLGLSRPVPDLSAFRAQYASAPSAVMSAQCAAATAGYKLLAFNHPIFDTALLPGIAIEAEEELPNPASRLDFSIPFHDTKHWHNTKSILPRHLGGDDEHKALDERQRRRAIKGNQRFMATLQKSAATLTGAHGTSLQQITIVSGKVQKGRSGKERAESERQGHGGPLRKKGKAADQLNSKEKLLEQIKQKKTALQDEASYEWWRNELSNMAKMTGIRDKADHVKSLLRNKRSEEPLVGLEMRLYSLDSTLLQWINDPKHASQPIHDKYALSVMKQVKVICDRKTLTPFAANIIQSVLTSLGFSVYATSLLSDSVNLPERSLAFPFTKLLKHGKPIHSFMAITEHPITWQLRLFGEFMDRSMDSAPDPRVAFKPDAWQREVLDCIDDRYSVLVIAPTSAGKTFISYYSMEKILRDSDDGILVYVAPTKALVTQIAAEIYARFKKNLDSRSLWAIHTRDYRINDPLKCQILVTVPEILATLLLSPPLARVWTPRLKSIILDEIHSIGQQEGGAVWEQIILMAPCPIIGLSATIGSPQDFSQWLGSVQEAHGFKYRAIEHPHRYSHLRKFYYSLPDETTDEARLDETLCPDASPSIQFKGLLAHEDTKRSRFLHPISLLSFGTRSMPQDLALEASDALNLYRALRKHAPGSEVLDPQIFFNSDPGPTLLVQKDIIRYECALKKQLSSLLKADKGRGEVSMTIIRDLQDAQIGSATNLNTLPSRDCFSKNLIVLLSDLHVKGELPAILFNFDRTECEILVREVLSALENAENDWRQESRPWKAKVKQWEDWHKRAKERERLSARAAKQRKQDDAPAREEQAHSWESSFDPDDPSPEFSFAGTTSYSKSDLADHIHELRRWTSTPEWALAALRRGVGVHHAGMNKRYRTLIESLFRQGFLRVMLATGTLALGINAPAKTAVFCGDSPYLTALMYRQCSGRAGRRGFDLLGNVVFYGIPMDRVQRLVLSKLPALGGNFPLTSTLSLRLMNLLNGSGDAESAVQAVKSIMSLPRISFISEMGRDQVLHHMRFSIEYLRRSGLLDKDGRPMNLFSLAAHLYYHEPNNFALIALLKSGALHKICEQNDVSAKRDFILIMAHLFGRRYISRVYASNQNTAHAKKLPSMVVLPQLPKAVRKVFVEHDREILHTFTGYALACGAQLEDPDVGPDSVLPLSKISYSLQSTPQSASTFRTGLRQAAIRVVARSPFVANSGHADSFKSVEELANAARRGLHLNNNAIPSLKHLTTTEGGHVLNAYLLDFYIHGQVATLARANGIRRGDVWYLLQDFTLVLATIENALKQLLQAASSSAAEADDTVLVDPAEMEDDVADDESLGTSTGDFERPAGVRDGDWRLYTVARGALREFEEKFKAMWA